MMDVVHFGAGNIGKGLVGVVLIESGHRVCFVDVDPNRVACINKDNSYNLQILDEDKEVSKIFPAYALNSITDESKIIDKIINADLITTSVGVNNLNKIAPLIVLGLEKRIKAQKENIDIIANENAINASSLLRDEIVKITSKDQMDMIDTSTGFSNSAIDRQALLEMVDDKEIVVVEPYFEWVINKSEITNEKTLSIKGALYVDDMDFYITRKLYCVNAGHATAAYMGSLYGYLTIQDALNDDKIKEFVRNTMKELSAYLTNQYDISPEEMDIYINKTLGRFMNIHLKDSVYRVGRSPIRKLSKNDRLIGPATKLNTLNLPVDYISKVIAAAFIFDSPEDTESVEIQTYIQKNNIQKAIKYYTNIDDESLINYIEKTYNKMKPTSKEHFIL